MAKLHQTIEGYKLGFWVNNQRMAYRNNKLSEERIKLLEAIPGWTWNRFDSAWQTGFDQLKKYGIIDQRHTSPDGYHLGSWISMQRKRKDRLSKEQIRTLESVPGWTWTPYDTKWEIGFNHLKKYGIVRQNFITPDGYKLGKWIPKQRAAYKANKLSEERIRLMETIPGWKWRIYL